MTTHEQIASAYEEYLTNNQKFEEKGFKASGVRTRNSLLELEKLIKIRRAEILEQYKKC